MKRIGVFTSGGDAPGMNACIRAAVRVAIDRGLEVSGILRGYRGMIAGEVEPMTSRSASNIVHRGGTILHSGRSEEFMQEAGRRKAAEVLAEHEIDGLVAIGGDGTFHGAVELARVWDGGIVGCPGTIDNDLVGSDFTIGYDTAVNTAMEAVDRLRDTAQAHDRLFFVEVMGRHAGFIGLEVGVAGGAEEILIPETRTTLEEVARRLQRGVARGKSSFIIVVSEGDEEGGAFTIAQKLKGHVGIDYRVSILGHIQRGGSPTARDRVLGAKLGSFAVESLIEGETGVMAGEIGETLTLTPFPETWEKKKPIDKYLWRLTEVLAT
jgi:6-phosphofructokinase 1